MRVKFLAILMFGIIFLTGCTSLDCEITHAGQKCLGNQCQGQRCVGGDCDRFWHQAVPQDEFCNNGAASYDTYRVIKRCSPVCVKQRVYKQ